MSHIDDYSREGALSPNFRKSLKQSKLFDDQPQVKIWDLDRLEQMTIEELSIMAKEMNDMRARLFRKDDMGGVGALDVLMGFVDQAMAKRGEKRL